MQRCREPERGGGDGRGGERQRTQAHHQVPHVTTSPTAAKPQLQVRYNLRYITLRYVTLLTLQQ
jgi:hypothetical protein